MFPDRNLLIVFLMTMKLKNFRKYFNWNSAFDFYSDNSLKENRNWTEILLYEKVSDWKTDISTISRKYTNGAILVKNQHVFWYFITLKSFCIIDFF